MRGIVNRFLPLIIILAAFLIAVGSCEKSNNNGSGSGSGSMTASINNSVWSANYGVGGSYTVADSMFDVAGAQIKSGDTTGFSITFYAPITVNKAFSTDTTSTIDIQYADAVTGAL
ncbi:MAG TPA: hypothetical protein VKR41_10425, partial [Puia sp.]|nr:hypothetical protein [Puia sp.]